jgi:hypothetical protein
MRLFLSSLCVLLLFYHQGESAYFSNSNQQVFTVQVGSQKIILPYPKGFIDPTLSLPKLKKEAEQFTSDEFELLSLLISREDEQRIIADPNANLRNHIMVQTYRNSKLSIMSKQDFIGLKNSYRQSSLKLYSKTKDKVNKLLKDKGVEEIHIAELLGLGVLDESPNHITLGLMSEMKNGSQNIVVLVINASVFIKGKVIVLNIYSPYDDKIDLINAKQFAKDWIQIILQHNT